MSHHVCHSSHIVKYLIRSLPSPNLQEDIIYETCWGDRIASSFPTNPTPSRLYILAKVAGYIFEEIVVCVFTQYNIRKFTQDRITKSINFFFLPYGHIPPENDSPLVRIVKTIDQLGGNIEDQANLMRSLLYSAFNQHVFDPPEFVSHGFDHALNVAYYCEMVYANQAISSKFQKYHGLGNDRILAIIKLLAYLHDCGYPYLHGREKANHAVYSADRVDEFREPLRKVFGNSILDFDNFYLDFRSAVFSHNADDDRQSFDARQATSSGSFLLMPSNKETVHRVFDYPESGLRPPREYKRPWYEYEHKDGSSERFKGRRLDLFYPKDGKLGLERVSAELTENPFQMIRIADNLDFVYERGSDLQKKPVFKELYRKRYDIAVKSKELETFKKERIEKAKRIAQLVSFEVTRRELAILEEAEIEHLQRLTELEEEIQGLIHAYRNFILQNNDLREVAAKIDGESFKHFGGCEAIVKVDDIIITDLQTTVFVQINKELWDQLKTKDFKEELENGDECQVTIAQYQMFRAWKAFQYIKIDRRQISQGLTFKVNGQIEPIYAPQRTVKKR